MADVKSSVVIEAGIIPLNSLIQFWDYAKKNNLEEIAYKLSVNMLSSIEANSENMIYGSIPKLLEDII